MGYMRHHAIVVSSWNEQALANAHAEAVRLFAGIPGVVPSSILPEVTNGYRSFFVPPDGSKEGWDISTDGDAAREAFVVWLDAQRYDDGSTALGWVEVQYGDDNGMTAITRTPTPGSSRDNFGMPARIARHSDERKVRT